jgi:RNA polymerase sigma-70 factor (ECF subfamily)
MNGSAAILMTEAVPSRVKRPPADSASDGLLVAAARRGDVHAFEQLYRMHSAKVLGLCLRMTRQRELAEDCVQQAFVSAWRNLRTFEGRSAFSSWLHRIAVNEVISLMRSRKPWLESQIDEAAEHSPDLQRADTADGDVSDVERALASLPEGARYVVVLQSIYGYSHEEVADMLGIAVGTCKAQLHRARGLLREKLGILDPTNAAPKEA